MNNLAIIPDIILYALQNQNVERKYVKTLDQKFNKESENEDKYEIKNTEINSNYVSQIIPDILIPNPKDEPENLSTIGETFINNDNILLVNE